MNSPGLLVITWFIFLWSRDSSEQSCAPASSPRNPDNEILPGRMHKERCYAIVTSLHTRNQTSSVCLLMGGKLASLDTNDTATTITNYLNSKNSTWQHDIWITVSGNVSEVCNSYMFRV